MSLQAAPATNACDMPASTVTPDKTVAGKLVGRNAMALVASQFITTPVSMVVNALLARRLGASNFGAVYFATTVLTLAFLLVEWGGTTQVAADVARDRSSAPRVFGSGLVLRILLAAIALLAIPYFGRWMHYDSAVQLALTLCGFRMALQSIGTLCSAVVRGFEKLHWHAVATVSGNLIDATLVISTVLAGGGLQAALTAQVISAAITAVVQIMLVFRLGIGTPRVDRGTLRALMAGGFSFVVLELVARMQPYIDASFLSRLAPPEALGWYSAATRITGVLIFPATTLTFALYPTLARLWQTDRSTCDAMVRLGLRFVMLLGILAGTGTVVFAPLIVRIIYGEAAYAPAANTLSILAAYVLLVYTSIIVGTFLVACGRQWRWALAQSFCLVVSVALDPILIPWTQSRFGNGSLGICMSVVTAEIAMVSFGLLLLPEGPLDRSLVRTLRCSLLSAFGMAAVGFVLRPYPIVAIPATVATYAGLLWVQRELDPDMLILVPEPVLNLLHALQRKTSRT
ncbi:MAG: oligosaccharide flippase family protein [Vicinamibacterales bacterium]